MPIETIPQRYWAAFLRSFSRKHRGWLVRMETDGHAGEAGVRARDIALTSIALEPKPPDGEISILLGGPGGLTHWIDRPEAIELEENEEGADRALAIRSDDGSKTVLRFGSAALPERVNGIAQ